MWAEVVSSWRRRLGEGARPADARPPSTRYAIRAEWPDAHHTYERLCADLDEAERQLGKIRSCPNRASELVAAVQSLMIANA